MGAQSYVPRSGFGGTAANTPKTSLVGTTSQAGMLGFAGSSPPLQTPIHGRVYSVPGGIGVCTSNVGLPCWNRTGWYGQENPLNSSPASFFFPCASPCEALRPQHPAEGSCWHPIRRRAPGAPPWDPRPLLCRTT